MNSYKSRYWADLTVRDFAGLDAKRTIAVLPVAATEQHGPHLPVSVDTSLADGIVTCAVTHIDPALSVLFLPTQQVGKSNEHARFPGTLTLSATTLIQVWMEIGACVAAAGIKKLVLFNSHGGQVSVMDIVARDLRARHDLIVFATNWYTLPCAEFEPGAVFDARELRFGIHAGDMETSMMLHLRPQFVDMQFAQDFVSSSEARSKKYPILGNGSAAKLAWQMQDLNPLGAAGDATKATAERGRMVVNAAGKKLAELLLEIDALPLNTLEPTAHWLAPN
ncbi:MAG: creatininase family protein [Rhodoferax sp.]|nr:creatininase family protein [Rhodoferax sp.]